MGESILAYEAAVRLIAFTGILAAMQCREIAAPRRRRAIGRRLRWAGNLGIVLLNTLVLRALFPVLAVGLALAAEQRGWGLLNVLGQSGWVAFVASLLALDLTIYFQHLMFHAVPVPWRLLSMHHADLEFDATTGVRFHPLEIVLSIGLKLGFVLAFGPPTVAVLVLEVVPPWLNIAVAFASRLPLRRSGRHKGEHSTPGSWTGSPPSRSLPEYESVVAPRRDVVALCAVRR